MLLRFAEMLQWQEQCAGAQVHVSAGLVAAAIDSAEVPRAGRPQESRCACRSRRAVSRPATCGSARSSVDAAALANDRLDSALQAKPAAVSGDGARELPSNLAISFRDVNGALYAGDPEHRAVGDVRVSYRIIPAGKVELIGMQRGDRAHRAEIEVDRTAFNPDQEHIMRITGLYAAIAALLVVILARARDAAPPRGRRSASATAATRVLAQRIRVHANAAEYLPLALLLLLILELNQTQPLLLHVFGCLLIAGRLLHAFGLSSSPGLTPGRAVGMVLTWAVIAMMALLLIWQVLATWVLT